MIMILSSDLVWRNCIVKLWRFDVEVPKWQNRQYHTLNGFPGTVVYILPPLANLMGRSQFDSGLRVMRTACTLHARAELTVKNRSSASTLPFCTY